MSKFKVGDKVRLLCAYSGREAGTEDTVVRVDGPEGDALVTLKTIAQAFDWRLELVEEVKPEVPTLPGVPEGYRAVRFGQINEGEYFADCYNHADKWFASEASNTCYLIIEPIALVEPPKPKTRAVKLVEYVVWDVEGQECLIECAYDPLKETEFCGAWKYAHPTGNVREIEVPLKGIK